MLHTSVLALTQYYCDVNIDLHSQLTCLCFVGIVIGGPVRRKQASGGWRSEWLAVRRCSLLRSKSIFIEPSMSLMTSSLPQSPVLHRGRIEQDPRARAYRTVRARAYRTLEGPRARAGQVPRR